MIAQSDSKGMKVVECEINQFQLSKFFYQQVGKDWQWTDRLGWTDEQWRRHAEADSLRTWIGYYKGSPAGYFELQQQNENGVEIAFFGLLPEFIGLGMGGFLLTKAVESAWAWDDPPRVWLHTCSLDHPHAIKNYRARGFEVYRTEVKKG